MRIIINGDEIDYTLEEERSAGDVLDGLASWLDEAGLLVGGVSLDGEDVTLADEAWKKRSVDGIEAIEVEAVSVAEGRIRQLETARDFFILLRNSAETGDAEPLAELSAGFGDLLRILPHLLGESSSPSLTPLMAGTLAAAGFPAADGAVSDAGTLAAEAARMAAVFEARRRETASPGEEAAAASRALADMAEGLDDVAVDLQTGKDRKAMDAIILLTELLQSLMRSLSWSGRDDAEDLADGLNGILAELEDALKASDTVLIGDLLEYEIKPRLLELPGKLGAAGETAS